MNFSDLILNMRQKTLLTQDRFANEIQVSVSTVNRWESGSVIPNVTAMKHIKEFCEKYELPFNEIEHEWMTITKERKERKRK